MYSHLLDCGGADGPPTPSCVASRPSAAAAAVVAGIVPPALAATPSPEPLSASEWGSCEAAPSPSPSPCETANGRPCRVRCPRALPEGFSPDGGGEQDSGDEAAGHATGERTATRKFRGVWLDRKRNKFKTRIWVQGRTLFLGSHTDEDEAARAYDQVAISRGGAGAFTNFPLSEYDVETLVATPLPTLVAELRGQAVRPRVEQQSSRHRGVCRHKTGKWSARIQDRGAKFFLGLFDTEQEAADAFDKEAAAIARGHSCSGSLEVEVPRTPRAPRKSYAPPADDEDYEPDPDEARAPPRPPKKRRTPSAGACGAWARGGGGSADIGDTSVVHAALTLLRMAAA